MDRPWHTHSVSADGPDGSPLDALYFLALILAGLWVLGQRHAAIGAIVRNNRWLVALFIYGFLAILWSDFPFIAFKRWIKTLGHPVMALIILTDPNPVGALRIVMKRCAYLLIPFSVLLIKYFPQYGRSFDTWSGQPTNNGVGLTKNDLGYQCLIFGLFFCLEPLDGGPGRGPPRASVGIWSQRLIPRPNRMAAVAGEQRDVSCLIRARGRHDACHGRCEQATDRSLCCRWTGLGRRGELAFDLYASLLDFVGRDPTLTDRTKVWVGCSRHAGQSDLGSRIRELLAGPADRSTLGEMVVAPQPGTQRIYRDLLEPWKRWCSYLLACVLVSTFRKITKQALIDFDFARFRLAFPCCHYRVQFYGGWLQGRPPGLDDVLHHCDRLSEIASNAAAPVVAGI